MSTCSCCKKSIGLLAKEYHCAMCGRLICSNCVHKWKDNVEQFELILDCEVVVPFIGDNYLPICPHCLGTMHSNNSKYEWSESNCEDVEIVSANYKGHKKYIPNSEICISSTSYRNREEAKHELRAMAKYYGRDMIIDCKCEKKQCQDGNYIYNEWGYSGTAVNKK